ncbi:MAG: hypothetical protein WCJ92_00075 [Alphaproteobacteria bacterium]
MKKKLLFSLLLGTAFIWTNKLCAAAEAAPAIAAEEVKPAGDKTAVDAPKEAIKYKVPTVSSSDGKTYTPGPEIEFSYYKENDQTIYDSIPIMDSGITQDAVDSFRKLPTHHSGPFVPGQELSKGYRIVNVWVKKDPSAAKDEKSKLFGMLGNMVVSDPSAVTIQIEGADGNINGPLDADHDIPADHYWALMNDQNEIFISEVKLDPKAEAFYGDSKYSADASITLASQAFTRFFKIPNEEATTKLQEALKKSAELEKAAGSGSGASSEEVEKLKTELAAAKAAQSNGSAEQAIDPSAPLTETFDFEGMKFLVLTSSAEAKKHPELFYELVKGLLELFSTQPKVATAIIATMLKSDPTMEGGGQFVNVSVSNAYKMLGSDKEIDLVADVQFSTDISYVKAEEFITGLKVKYNNEDVVIPEPPVPAEEVAELQAKQEDELKAKEEELAKIKAEAEHAINVAAQLNKEKAELEAKANAAELATAQVTQQRDAAITVAAQAYDKVAETTAVAEHNAQIAEHNAEVAQNTQEALSQAEEAHAVALDAAAAPVDVPAAPGEALPEAPVAEHAAIPAAAPGEALPEAPVAEHATIPAAAPVANPTSVMSDLDAIAKEHGVPNNKQLTADILNKSVPHPLVSSLASASAAPAA